MAADPQGISWGSESIGATTIDSFEWLKRPGSVGRVAKGVPHYLDEAGRELPPGRIGAIYFGEPGKTAERTSPRGLQTIGDFGSLDEDGYLYLSDRIDDMIISGGVNLYPCEIELAIEEAPVAFVVRAKPDLDDEDFVDGLRAFCRLRLGKTKQVKAFQIVEALPRSALGKLLRRQLRDFVKAKDRAD